MTATSMAVKKLVLDLPHLDGRVTTADEVAGCLESHGAVVIDNLVAKETMDQLSKDLRAVSGLFYGEEGSFAGAHTVRNAGKPLGESVVAQRLALHPLINAAIQQRLGRWCKRVVLGTCSAISVEAPPSLDIAPAPPQILHRDESMWGCSDWPWLPQTTSDRPELAITVMWALSDFTKNNGATRVIPGSHRWPRSGIESQDEDDDLAKFSSTIQSPEDLTYPSTLEPLSDEVSLEQYCIPAVMTKGSVLLWSGATIHGQGAYALQKAKDGADESTLTREGLLFIYNVGWLRPEHNFHWAIPSTVWDTFPQELQILLGKVGNNRVVHDWYTGPVYAQPVLGTAPQDSSNLDQVGSRACQSGDYADTYVAGAT